VVAVLTLALGIGANTTIFSVVNALLLRPLPYTQPDRLVMVWEKRIREGVTNNVVSPADFIDWRQRNQVFESMAAQTEQSFDLSGIDEPIRLYAGVVSSEFFDVLGVQPQIGRAFLPEEEQAGRHLVAVLTHSLWQERFGADPGVVGRKIQLSGETYDIIGVLPPSFRFSNPDLEIWCPINFSRQSMQSRTNHTLFVYARMKPGLTVEEARASMDQLGEQMMAEHPQESNGHSAHVIGLHEQLTGDIRLQLFFLFAAVGMVLLIACANVANLLLVRAAGRQKEMAIRTALGAGRWRIARQLLTESMVLAVLGGISGVLISLWGVYLLQKFLPAGLLSLNEAKLDLWTLAFTMSVSLLTGFLFGLTAMIQSSRPNVNEILKAGGRGLVIQRSGLRNAIVVSEIALTLILLACTGLLVRSFLKMRSVKPGFNQDNVLTAKISLPGARYKDHKQVLVFYDELLKRVRELPGVETASAAALIPLGGGDSRMGFGIEGRDSNPDLPTRAHIRVAASDYFTAMQMRLVEGRWFTERDTLDSPTVVLINETAARRYWPGDDPVGKRVRFAQDPPGQWREVIGIVGDIRYWGLSKDVNPEMYFPHAQVPRWDMQLVARTTVEPSSLAAGIREQLRQMDKDVPLAEPRTMERVVDESVESPRSYMLLVMVFAVIAVLLSAVGVYGVISSSVAQRTNEIGIRVALGAQRRDVVRMVVLQGLKLTSVGVGIGLVGAWGLTRLISSFLYQVQPTDTLTFVVVAVLLVLVALFACQLPARRATKVDPVIALRYE
jgi:putative ABC transport system permease protein